MNDTQMKNNKQEVPFDVWKKDILRYNEGFERLIKSLDNDKIWEDFYNHGFTPGEAANEWLWRLG